MRKNSYAEPIVRDGYIIDYITGKEIRGGEEEELATQPYSKILVEDYNFSKDQIQTRPQFKVRSRPSDTRGTYPVDIAVFKNNKKREEDLYIIIECKKPTEKEGIKQLEDYLRLSYAELGVWFNGKDAPIYIRKVIKDSGVFFEKIPNIPKNGERLEDIGHFLRKDLKPTHNLKYIFRTLRNYLSGNTIGITRDEELAKQLINIIFTKIYDERFKKPDEKVDFRAGIDESPNEVKFRINKLFDSVKGKYKDVININDSIDLDEGSLYYVVGILQGYCLIEVERDVIADAFETFIGHALKGPQGQFFTPRNVVNLMVEVLSQSPDEKIIDPACGSGGFIVESLKHIWRSLDEKSRLYNWTDLSLQEEKVAVAMTKIYGIEKDSFLSKVAKAYMAILGDGKGGIFCEDSLDEIENWKIITQQQIHLDSFDCLLANPPFGKDIKVVGKEKLKQYQLAHKWRKDKDYGYIKTNSLNKEMPPQILFIERCISLLRTGGRMGIIIPETYFHAPRSQYVMNFMAQHNIYCLIDLPHNTFRPHNNAKCIVIFIEKNIPQQEKIMMCVAEEIGHDHQGKEIYRWDYDTHESTNEIWDDTPLIIDEINKLKSKLNNNENWIRELVQSNESSDLHYTFWVNSQEVKESNVYVPRYYWKNKENRLLSVAKEKGYEFISIKSLIDNNVISYFDGHGSPKSENKGKGDIPYIRVKDIVNWEVYKDPTSMIPFNVYQTMVNKKKKLKIGDVLYVRRGSYRIGSVAMVSPYDTEVLLTREILVLRVNPNNEYGITPYYLLYLLSHNILQEQAKNKILIETTLPNIANRWMELFLPVHIDLNKRKEVSEKIKKAIDAKWDAVKKINDISLELGNLIT